MGMVVMRKRKKMTKRRKISSPRLLPFFWLLQMYISYATFIFFHACLIWSFCNSHFFWRCYALITKVERVIYSFCCVISLHLRCSFVAFICLYALTSIQICIC